MGFTKRKVRHFATLDACGTAEAVPGKAAASRHSDRRYTSRADGPFLRQGQAPTAAAVWRVYASAVDDDDGVGEGTMMFAPRRHGARARFNGKGMLAALCAAIHIVSSCQSRSYWILRRPENRWV
jgi:hypothetical protein